MWLFGQVERVGADGAAKPLAKGDAVFEGDVIRTAAGSHAQFIMSDEALLAVRAESGVKLSKYVYAGREDGTERALIELLKGGLRSVTGPRSRSRCGGPGTRKGRGYSGMASSVSKRRLSQITTRSS